MCKHFQDQKAVYALVSNTLKHRHLIEKMRKVCYKHNNLGHLDETLLEIAIAKIIFERKVSTKSLPCDILEFKVPYDLRKLLKELKSKSNYRQKSFLSTFPLQAQRS